MDQLALIEIIECYIEGRLAPEDRAAFERRMEENPDLRNTVWEYQELIEGIRRKGAQEFLNQTKDWENQRAPQQIPLQRKDNEEVFKGREHNIFGRRRTMYALALAACLILLVVIFIPKRIGSGTLDAQLVYESHFEPYPDLFTVMGESVPEKSTLDSAISAYNRENYNEALQLFQSITSQYPDSLAPVLYAGVSHMALGQFKEAHPILKRLVNHPNTKYKEVAEYYLALNFLGLDEISESKRLLTEISENTNHDYQEESKEILDELNEIIPQ